MAQELGKFTAWPDTAVDLTTEEVIAEYNAGRAGAFRDPEVSEQLDDDIRARGGEVNGADLAHRYGFAGGGRGKCNILYVAVVMAYGLRALTKPGQKTGDCVSMAGRDVSLFLICLEWLSKIADEQTGKLEDPPKVSDKAAANGVFCNEGIYKNRGHNGQGMACSQGVRWITTEGGILIRKPYEQADLEAYNVQFESRGGSGSPQWLKDESHLHPVRDVTRVQGHENAADFIDRGKPIWVCSDLGFSDRRDENGYAKRQGSWGHSWHVVGCDWRDVVLKKYGFPLALVGHRWAVWNSGGREIMDSEELAQALAAALETTVEALKALGVVGDSGKLLIPEGYWWIDGRLLDRCEMYAVSGAAGWASTGIDMLGGF